MRINHTKRIFMNEADSSPGNGAPAAPPDPAEPQAQAAPAPDLSQLVSQIVTQVTATVEERLAAQENKIFANLRKAGALGKDKTEPTQTASTAPASAPPAPAATSADEVRAIIARERAITFAAVENKLTTQQIARITSAIEAEKPDEPAAWVKSFLADMGIARPADQPVTPAQPVQQTNGSPISDKGSPAPGGAVAWEREFAENPIGMSKAAYALMVAKHGEAKARQMRLDASRDQASRIKVTL